MEKIAQNPLMQGVRGFGDVLHNMPKAAYSSLTGEEYNPLITGKGTAYEVGKGTGSIAPWLIPGPHQATMPARILTGGIAGGLLNPQDTREGVIEGLEYAAIGEALPPIARTLGKGVSQVANKFTRAESLKDWTQAIQKEFSKEKNAALSYLKPLEERFGATKFSGKIKEDINNIFEGNKDYLSKHAKTLKNEFNKTPTLKMGQKLQSRLGEEARKLDPSIGANMDRIDALEEIRSSIKRHLGDTYEHLEPGAKEKYNTFLNEYAAGPGVFENNKITSKLIKGKTHGITPSKLNKELQIGIEGEFPKILPQHYLAQLAPEVKQQLGRSDIYQGLAGGLAGTAAFGPMGAIAAGLPKAASFLKPDMSFLVHEEIARLLGKAGKQYPKVRSVGMGIGLNPEYEEIK